MQAVVSFGNEDALHVHSGKSFTLIKLSGNRRPQFDEKVIGYFP